MGGFNFLWSVNIMGGDHGSIFLVVLFQFLPFLGRFCNFGLFLHFWVVFAFLGGFGKTSDLYDN